MLDLYKNIKKYRKHYGITQGELAKMAGYKDKSMIAKIEKGLVDLPQSKIVTFAELFDIEPSELMGWTDYSKGIDGSGETELEKFRDSLMYKASNKRAFIANGLDLMIQGLYDKVEECVYEDIDYIKLTRGDYEYLIEPILLETIEDRVSQNIRGLIKDFCNKMIIYEEDIMLNAAHECTDKKVTQADVKHDEDIMDDDNF